MQSIEEYYERYWENPDDYTDPSTPARQSLLQRFLKPFPPGSRLLDVGCGAGEFCEFFRSLGFNAEGMDLSNAAIAHARQAYPAITFHAGAIETLLPMQKGRYRVVFSSEVIELPSMTCWIRMVT